MNIYVESQDDLDQALALARKRTREPITITVVPGTYAMPTSVPQHVAMVGAGFDAKRIAELEAQVDRLQDAVRTLNEHMGDETGNPYSEAEVIATYGLCPGDLDPVKGGDDGE